MNWAQTEEEYFWMRVEPVTESGCWIWTGITRRKYGYVEFYRHINKTPIRAHRFSYRLHYGDFDKSLHVLHKCDVPCCVNPNHLFLGTQLDNIQDRNHKARQSRGEKHGRAKLTEANVREIRNHLASGRSARSIGRQYGVCHHVVRGVRDGTIWKHIQ